MQLVLNTPGAYLFKNNGEDCLKKRIFSIFSTFGIQASAFHRRSSKH